MKIKLGKIIKEIFTHARFHIWALWACGPVLLLTYGIQFLTITTFIHWPRDLLGEVLAYLTWSSMILLGLMGASMLLISQTIKNMSIKVGAAEIEVETTASSTNTELSLTQTTTGSDDGSDDGSGRDGDPRDLRSGPEA